MSGRILLFALEKVKNAADGLQPPLICTLVAHNREGIL